MEIYIDVIILENFVINLFLLLLTFKLMRFEYKRKIIYLAAFIGAVYTVVLFTDIKVLTSIWAKIIVAIGMILLAIEKKNIMNVIKCTMLFFINSIVLSGLCFVLASIQNPYLLGNEFVIEKYSIKWLILSTMIFYIVITRISEMIRERAVVKNFMYDICISVGDQILMLKGFLDTGNELREVVSNLPCIIIEERCLKEVQIKDRDKYIINYNTITENGKIEGFKSDKVMIRNNFKDEWVNVEAIICKSPMKFSKENDYQALLSRGII